MAVIIIIFNSAKTRKNCLTVAAEGSLQQHGNEETRVRAVRLGPAAEEKPARQQRISLKGKFRPGSHFLQLIKGKLWCPMDRQVDGYTGRLVKYRNCLEPPSKSFLAEIIATEAVKQGLQTGLTEHNLP